MDLLQQFLSLSTEAKIGLLVAHMLLWVVWEAPSLVSPSTPLPERTGHEPHSEGHS